MNVKELRKFAKDLRVLCEKHNILISNNRLEVEKAEKIPSAYKIIASKTRKEWINLNTYPSQREVKGDFIEIYISPKKEKTKKSTLKSYKNFYCQSFQEFVSPIDGKVISSTSQLRDHERQYGVKQVGNDLITKKEQQ